MSAQPIRTALLAAALIVTATRAAHAQLDPNAFTSLGTLNDTNTAASLNFNTDTLTVTGPSINFTGVALAQASGPQIAVFDFSSINIASGISINIQGTRALALLSQGSATIQSLLFMPVPGGSGPPNAGGYIGGSVDAGSDAGITLAQAGQGPGGGGAIGTTTGGGGFGGTGGSTLGGPAYGNLFQSLAGGSGGGAGITTHVSGAGIAQGGNGGGAIEIVSTGNLTIGSVSANGSSGFFGFSGNDVPSSSGGSGGGILLSGGTGLAVTGSLTATGGSVQAFNGGAASGGGGGRIALSGLSNYVLTSSSLGLTTNLSGGNANANGAGGAGNAGVITLDPVNVEVPLGTTITLSGTPLVSVAGSTTQATPTIETYVRHDLLVHSGAIAILGINNALQHLNSSGTNITTLDVEGTFNLNGYSQTVDTLTNNVSFPGSITLPSGSTLTVGAGNGSPTYTGQFTGAGTLVKTGNGTLTFSGASASFTGTTTVSSGSLSVANNLALQSSAVTLSGGNLIFSSVTAPVIGALAGTSNLSLAGLTSYSVGANNSTTTYSGNLSGSLSGGLAKTGTGTWMLNGTNTQSGPLNIQGGTLLVGSNSALSANAPITVSAAATLDLDGYNYNVASANVLNVQGTLRLGGAGLTVASGVTAIYNGCTVSNGFLLGAGTNTLTGGAKLSSVTTAASTTINQTGTASVINFTHNGQFTNAVGQPLNWTDGTVTSAGRLTVSGTVTVTDFVTNGVVTINGTGTLTNVPGGTSSGSSSLFLGGGSRTTINAAGKLTAGSGTTIELNGGLLINNGTIAGTTDVNYGSLAKGIGTYGVVNVGQGGVYAPGNSPGIVTAAAVSFDSAPVITGAPQLQIELAGTTPGTQYDQLHVTGQLSLGGTLQVVLINSFTPASGNSFDIMDWSTITGTFNTLQLPGLTAPLGWDTSQLYTTGVLSVTATLHGDWNRDGQITSADIPAMLKALTDLSAYTQANSLNATQLASIGDFDTSGNVTNRDIQGLLDLIAAQPGGGSTVAVPEPATIGLLALGLFSMALIIRRPAKVA